MRLDLMTVFPEYFDVLQLALLGKARQDGVIDVNVHDLREFTHDRHRTVDDTPSGGGPGMLMRPEPWGEALDHVVAAGASDAAAAPLLLVPTPAGEPLTQERAEVWSHEPWLAFACGRYEGIDQRVIDHARQSMRVVEVSVGDYVLNGGEVAALVVIESVVRLIPGVIGNQDSLLDESHVAGLLEAPGYTKPATWRGQSVPEVLLSGNHAVIARWRRHEALRRTSTVRPDLIERLNPAVLDQLERAFLAELGWSVTNGRFSRSSPTVAD
jgi:tRNA (guanine37-N1)-methyltransferase